MPTNEVQTRSQFRWFGPRLDLKTDHDHRIESCNSMKYLRKYGTPEWIRTTDLLLRRQTLYPAELRAHNASTSIVVTFPSYGQSTASRLRIAKMIAPSPFQFPPVDVVGCLLGPCASHGEVAEWSKAAVC